MASRDIGHTVPAKPSPEHDLAVSRGAKRKGGVCTGFIIISQRAHRPICQTFFEVMPQIYEFV